MPRSASDDRIASAAKRRAARVLLPEPAAPTSRTSESGAISIRRSAWPSVIARIILPPGHSGSLGVVSPDPESDVRRQETALVQDWRVLVAIFCITSVVESLGVSQIFAFAPTYLTQMGVADADRLHFIGLFSALIFVVGAPLVPLWGVWADKYSRKVVIVRSALVEAVVFACVALSREPWQLAGSMLLVGFQLGNTGVMLAAIRDVAPRNRLGTAIALFGASGPIGMAIGPVLGGRIVDGLHQG